MIHPCHLLDLTDGPQNPLHITAAADLVFLLLAIAGLNGNVLMGRDTENQ